VASSRARGVTENDCPNCHRAVNSKAAAGTAMPNPAQRATVHAPGRNTTIKIAIRTGQNCTARKGVIFPLPDSRLRDSGGAGLSIKLFYETLANAVDEVGVGRGEPGGPHGRRNLSAMIGGVHDYVHQDVTLAAAPGFAFAVPVVD
jgi:hypothetical protein